MAITTYSWVKESGVNNTSFDDWVSSVGSTPKSLMVGTDITITGNLNVPSNIDFTTFANNSKINGIGLSITINKMSAIPRHQIFASGLNVVFGPSATSVILPEWWGYASGHIIFGSGYNNIASQVLITNCLAIGEDVCEGSGSLYTSNSGVFKSGIYSFGNISLSATKTVDGVDVSEIPTTYATITSVNTTSGILNTYITNVSGQLNSRLITATGDISTLSGYINNVSGQLDIRINATGAYAASVSGILNTYITNTSGILNSKINNLSGIMFSGYVPYSGATIDLNLGTNRLITDSILFNTTPSVTGMVGQIYWDADEKTLAVNLDTANGVTLQVGQEMHTIIVNKTGSQINDGQVVYLSGVQGNRPKAWLAHASTYEKSNILGVATQNILDNEEGYITTYGVVRGYNTTGFAAGDFLYLTNTSGSLSNNHSGVAFCTFVGISLNSTANGSIFVQPKSPISQDTTLSDSEDHIIASERAIKTYIDNTSGVLNTYITNTSGILHNEILYVSGLVGSGTSSGMVPTGTLINTTAPLYGGGPLSGNLTLYMTAASASSSGYLKSEDWITFAAGATGGVGPGTINRIAKFITTSGVGNSTITDDGTTVQVSGNITATGSGVFTGVVHGATPTVNTHLTTKLYVDNTSGVLNTKINNLSGFVTSGYVPYSGATMDVNIGTNRLLTDAILFNMNPSITGIAGQLYWDNLEVIPIIQFPNGMNLQVGEKQIIRVINSTGSTILDGQVVFMSGAQDNRPQVWLAHADTYDPANIIGVATEDISVNGSGHVITQGTIYGYNTTGFTAGDRLYLSNTSGSFTNTHSGINYCVFVGTVLNSTADGSIYIKPTPPISQNIGLDNTVDHIIPSQQVVKSYIDTASGSLNTYIGNVSGQLNTRINNSGAYSANVSGILNTYITNVSGILNSGKVSTSTTINTTAPLSGGGDLSTNRTISMSTASTNTSGYLTHTDWNTFNNKSNTSGTVTSFSMITANGLSGVVATSTTTPALTIYTSVTGVLVGSENAFVKGNSWDIPINYASGISNYVGPDDLQDFFNMGACGQISGGIISVNNGLSGRINVSAGSGTIATGPTANDPLVFCTWPAISNRQLTSGVISWIAINYSGGNPSIIVYNGSSVSDFSEPTSINYQDIFPLGTVVWDGNETHILNNPRRTQDAIGGLIRRFHQTLPFERDELVGGLIIAETGTRNITLSAGYIWDRQNRFQINAIDTSVSGNFYTYYRDGSTGFVKTSGVTQWNNTQYDNNAGTLTTMGASKYAVHWWYLEADGNLVLVYGRGEYTTATTAAAESIPSTLPTRLGIGARLIARSIFQKSASTYTSIDSTFVNTFVTSASSSHNNLGGLQGGAANEYYHLTSNEYTGTGSGNFVRESGSALVGATIGGVTIASTTYVNTASGALNTYIGNVSGQLDTRINNSGAYSANVSGILNTRIAATSGDLSGHIALTTTAHGGIVPSTRIIYTNGPLAGSGTLNANLTLSITQATPSQSGFISAADFTTFSGKVSSTRNINTTAPITGGGDLSADRTIAMSAASTNTSGYLTHTDWNTFNNKLSSSHNHGLGTSGYLSQYVSTSGFGNSVIFQSGNNIGLLTTNPGFPFQISNNYGLNVYVNQEDDTTIRYYKLGTYENNNGGIQVNGILAGHTPEQGRASINMQFHSRDGNMAYGSVIGSVGSSSLVVYSISGAYYTYNLWLKTDRWALANLDVKSVALATVTYDGSYQTTIPSGTLIYDLSGNANASLRMNNSGLMSIGSLTQTELLTLGTAGSISGTLSLAGGTSGKVIIKTQDAAGSYTMTLPNGTGSSGQFLSTDGTGSLSWANASGAGVGTVTSVSVTASSGVLATVTNPTSTPALAFSLTNITPTTVNSLTLASGLVGFTIAGGVTSKTLTVSGDASISGNNSGDQDLSSYSTNTNVNNVSGILNTRITTTSGDLSGHMALTTTAHGGLASATHNHGTGTSGYLSQFISTSGYGNSIIYQSGINIGINSINPGFPFQIGNSGGFIAYVNQDSDASGRYYQLGTFGSDNGAIQVNGILASHTEVLGRASIDMTFYGRGGFNSLGQVFGKVVNSDIVIYSGGAPTTSDYSVWLKTGQWSLVNLDVKAVRWGVVTYNGSYQSTVPSGTQVFSLSGNIGQTVRVSNEGLFSVGAITPTELLTLGTAGSVSGTLSLAGGTSGKVIIKTQAAAGSYTMTLPNSAGTSGQVLSTDGAGLLSWATSSGSGAPSGHALGSVYHTSSTIASVNSLLSDGDMISTLSGEINNLTAKSSSASGDLLVIEDSAATYTKKKIQIQNITPWMWGSGSAPSATGRIDGTLYFQYTP